MPNGKVSISWTLSGGGAAHFTWAEHGAPVAEGSIQKGFGHRVLTELVPRALQGSSRLEFAAAGVRWQLEIPSLHVLPGEIEPSARISRAQDTQS